MKTHVAFRSHVKFRAECLSDVAELVQSPAARLISEWHIHSPTPLSPIIVSCRCEESTSSKGLINGIKNACRDIAGTHLIAETVAIAADFTGERIPTS
jgi:hypothetical protein